MRVRHRSLYLVVTFVWLISVYGSAGATPRAWQFSESALQQLNNTSQSPAKIRVDRHTGVPASIRVKIPVNKSHNAQQAARSFFDRNKTLYGLKNVNRELKYVRTDTNRMNMKHVRFQQLHEGIPVYGGELIVHIGTDRSLHSVNGNFLPGMTVDTNPTKTPAEAIKIGQRELQQTAAVVISAPELLILDPGLLSNEPREDHLVWKLTLKSDAPRGHWVYFVDAHSGAVVLKYNNIKHFHGYNKQREIYDTVISPETLLIIENDPASYSAADSEAQAAYDHMGTVFDYFYNTFHRNSWDDNGAVIKVSVHDSFAGADGAYWSNGHFGFGDGDVLYYPLTVLDVVAHEFAHAISEISGFAGAAEEPRFLNESFADIFGVLVDADDWTLGEDMDKSGTGLRDVSDPPAWGDLDHYMDYDGSIDSVGIPSKTVYLISDGDTHNGFTVQGIGRNGAEQIYYDVMTGYLTSTSNFMDFSDSMIASVEADKGIGSVEAQAVETAMKSVGLGPDSDGDGLPDAIETNSGVFDPANYDVGTDPNNPDTDGDGIEDGEEFTYPPDVYSALETNPLVDDFLADDDGDGYSNVWEYTASSHPQNPGSTPNVNPIYVDVNNNSGNEDGLTLQTAFNTIQEGIDAAQDGDTVHIEAGTYTPAASFFTYSKSVRLLGAGAESTVLSVLYFVPSGVTWSKIEGLTILASDFNYLSNVRNVEYQDCRIDAANGTTLLNNARAKFTNCVLYGGTLKGINLNTDGDVILINSTLAGFPEGITVTDETESDVFVHNSILDNTTDFLGVTDATNITYSLISDGQFSLSNGNLSGNPGFVDAPTGDYHLQYSVSQAIDAGDPTDDSNNEQQPHGCRINMGAYGNTVEAAFSADPDSDGDLLTDHCETLAGTNINKSDSDNDGLTDYEEVNYDGNTANYDPYNPVSNPTGTDLDANSVDTDEDGFTDKHEVDAGFDPLDAASLPTYPAFNIELLSQRQLDAIGGGAGVNGADIWGWTDTVTSKEYAVFARTNGTAFVDISDPKNPVFVGSLLSATGNSPWRDVKVYADHAYIVSDNNGNHGMQVFDLTQLRTVTSPPVTFTETAHYSGFSKAHNILINEGSGYAYAVGTNTFSGGLHFIDLSSPAAPVSAGGFSADGYTHDAQVVNYQGPDSNYSGREIAFSSNDDALTIVDVTDKASPLQVSSATYSGVGYVHQGWLTEDQAFFISNDELDEINNPAIGTRTHIWNVSDLDNPVHIGYYEAAVQTIDHNLYTHNGLVFEANYTSGLRVLDSSNIANVDLSEVAYIDTHPGADLNTSPAGFAGAWSVYPYFPSGTIVISDINEGLFVVRLIDSDSDGLSDEFELLFGTNPLDADSDDDGLTDFEEVNYDGDSANYDPYNSVSNPTGTDLDANMPDTDNDGFNDGEEISSGSDPLDPLSIPGLASGDVNGDGFVNAADVVLAKRIALGELTANTNQRLRGNVAPLIGGIPSPNDVDIDAGDLLLIERKALGLVNF